MLAAYERDEQIGGLLKGTKKRKSLTYQSAGVDIGKADRFIRGIGPLVKATRRPGSMGSIGGFGGFFKIPKGLHDPILVSGTDGVGTKLRVAQEQKRHDTIGIDLVAMCVNDVVACGAEPLFFLDYYAVGALRPVLGISVVKGISEGCRQAGCAIVGGETAEMPGYYADNEYELAGFCVGVVERRKILDGSKVRKGDVLIGLESSGLHSNGYSLARKVFTSREMKGKWGRVLLEPTRIYVKPVLKLCRNSLIKSIAHITGGGFFENVNRCLPANMDACISKGSWPVPKVFPEIQKRGNVTDREMYRTFNMGIGMVVVASAKKASRVQQSLKRQGVLSCQLGHVTAGKNRVHVC